jgi:hypothetical protein
MTQHQFLSKNEKINADRFIDTLGKCIEKISFKRRRQLYLRCKCNLTFNGKNQSLAGKIQLRIIAAYTI